MTGAGDPVSARRDIIDRRALADRLARAGLGEGTSILKAALEDGRAEIRRRLEERPYAGTEAASAQAFLADQLVRLVHDEAQRRTGSDVPLLVMAVGGYGRGEMAPYSDVDIAFLTPGRPDAEAGRLVEAILYPLWDMDLKVGQSVHGMDELLDAAEKDHVVKTSLVEARYVWGEEAIFDEVQHRFWKNITSASIRAFAKEKLDERDARHRRMGDSRYVVEPNVKEGKGGLRDLHALFWIGKYGYRLRSSADLVDAGLFSREELRQFQRAQRFLWAVRCHLHFLAGRAEERLTFDRQSEIARLMRYADRPGKSPVERFMRHYFLHAKTVGDLTGAFLAHLDEKFARRGQRLYLPSIRRRPSRLEGFVLDRGRLAVPEEGFFAEAPIRLLKMFELADRHELEIHPLALRAAGRSSALIDPKLRADPEANATFLSVLTSPRDPETLLRWMNETGVFGRFIPDFGRVVGRMQFDMYHHYTVDEHSIRAIGLLSRIERGELREEHKLATELMRHIESRRALYVAVLLHDIAKGRGGDHSLLGADVARSLGPRLGLPEAETETVAWLVANHLLMSATAFKRDLADPKTIQDFAARVKSLERLRLLFLLTSVDIRAVGPGVWNSWKSQLLRDLFDAAEEVLRLGHKQKGRKERVAATQKELAERLSWPESHFSRFAWRLPDSYWLAETIEVLEGNARLIDAVDRRGEEKRIGITAMPDLGATLFTIYAPDQPGLFYRIAGAISLAGGNIVDARIHTTHDGMAVDNFLVQDLDGEMIEDPDRQERLEAGVARAIAGGEPLHDRLAARPLPKRRAAAFSIQPAAFFDNEASSRYTVVEVNARDRAALLSDLARALTKSGALIHSAHIATYGERAVDVFYLTDLKGAKIADPARLERLRVRLLTAAGWKAPPRKKAPPSARKGGARSGLEERRLRSGSGR